MSDLEENHGNDRIGTIGWGEKKRGSRLHISV
jgi:hypothetical protein